MLGEMELELPTGAQWEYAARAGARTVWWTGDERESVRGAANLADDFARANGGAEQWIYEAGFDDGWTATAPIGSFRRLCRAGRKLFLRAVFALYARKARAEGVEGGRTGAVNQIQRFGSALNANLHFHALVLDGVYTAPDPFTPPVFQHATRVTDKELARLLFTIRSRVLRLCRRRGLMLDEGVLDVGGGAQQQEQGLLPLIHAASIQGRVALGPEARKSIARLPRTPATRKCEAVVFQSLCAELDGFTLHAGVRIKAQEGSRLEHPCRYVLRPPLSAERLSPTDDGRPCWRLRAPFRDGTTLFVFDPLPFIERLAALVPRRACTC